MAAPLQAALRVNRTVRLWPETLVQRSTQTTIEEYARLLQNPVTLKRMYEFGRNPTQQTLLVSAKWLHQELPIRLAHRVEELTRLPFNLCHMPSVIRVKDMYAQSFNDIVNSPLPSKSAQEEEFSNLIYNVMTRHNDVVKLLARGLLELKQHNGQNPDNVRIQGFLDRFYMSRVSIRMLIRQHLGMHEARDGYVGIINLRCSPAQIARHAIEDVQSLSYRHYTDSPEIQVLGNLNVEFPYIEGHLYFMLFELLKNSVRATMETHHASGVVPPVKVILCGGSEDVTIKISDEGGGIARSAMPRIFTYLYTTAEIPREKLLQEGEGKLGLDPIAGFGYGLPLSRLHARYFGGDLQVLSMEGYGTDTFLYLNKVGDHEEAIK
mmetsp:Transcript_8951/g.18016  ORF Transcript_8951/g.18016 Transcript_8951/m.18016 type:complete len:379 (-) Transcript_8951:160-1296(-)